MIKDHKTTFSTSHVDPSHVAVMQKLGTNRVNSHMVQNFIAEKES